MVRWLATHFLTKEPVKSPLRDASARNFRGDQTGPAVIGRYGASARNSMALKSILEQLAEYDTALVANTIGYLDPTPPHQWYMG